MRDVIARARRAAVPSGAATRAKDAVAREALGLVCAEIEGRPEVTGAEYGGSYAKGTWLADGADIDIFIGFRTSVPEDEFAGIAREVGFAALRGHSPYVRYSDHPYVEASVRGTRVNVVPFYCVQKGRWRSAADRSPFHTRFMKASLTPAMRDEVRVLKRFLAANGVYGAEIARQGFSGYAAEVLVLHYGTLAGVLEAAAGMGPRHVVGRPAREFDTPVVMADPVDGNRNLGAAVSAENVGRLALAARAFLKKPSPAFFRPGKPPAAGRHWENLLAVRFAYSRRSPDMIWGQARRACASFSSQLEAGGFGVIRSRPFAGDSEACLLFLLESAEIPRTYVREGPEYFRREGADRFIAGNLAGTELMWVGGDGRINSLERRRFVRADGLARHLLRSGLRTAMPEGLHDDLARGFAVSLGRRGLGKSIKEAAAEMITTDGTILYFS